MKGLDAWRRSQTGWTSGNAGRRVWNSSVQEKQGGEYRTTPKLPRRPSCEATSARPRQPEGQIDENFGQDHLHRVIVTTGLDNIEALDPRSVFPGGSRKFLQFPNFPKVGPKPGEQRRTQVSTSASSGDLQPSLDEEPAPPLVQDQRAALLCNWQCYEVLVNVVTKSLVFPQWLLATLPTIKCLHIPNLHLPSVNTQHQGSSALWCLALSQQLSPPSWTLCSSALPMVKPTIVKNTRPTFALWRMRPC